VAVPMSQFWRDEISLKTSYAASPGDISKAVELIRGRRVNVREMVTHRFPLDQTQKGFEMVAAAADSMKVIVNPQD